MKKEMLIKTIKRKGIPAMLVMSLLLSNATSVQTVYGAQDDVADVASVLETEVIEEVSEISLGDNLVTSTTISAIAVAPRATTSDLTVDVSTDHGIVILSDTNVNYVITGTGESITTFQTATTAGEYTVTFDNVDFTSSAPTFFNVSDGTSLVVNLVGANTVTASSVATSFFTGGTGSNITVNGNGSLELAGTTNANGISTDGNIVINSGTLNMPNILSTSAITINDGDITVIGQTGNTGNAGIGSPSNSESTITIDINGGTVNAYSEGDGAGIGTGSTTGGKSNTVTSINITGTSEVVAYSKGNGAGIGTGSAYNVNVDTASSTNTVNNITIAGTANVTAHSAGQGAGIGSGLGYHDVSAGNFQSPYAYTVAGDITISGATVAAYSENQGAGIGSGYAYFSESKVNDITIDNGANVTAYTITPYTVHDAPYRQVSIYGGAGIGGASSDGTDSIVGNITITDSTVEAYATTDGAHVGTGIGSGASGSRSAEGNGNNSVGNITITNSDITAYTTTSYPNLDTSTVSSEIRSGAAIGAGYAIGGSNKAGIITITGGTVNATSTFNGAAIGSGNSIETIDTVNSSNNQDNKDAIYVQGIVINDSTVEATAVGRGAAIGGGYTTNAAKTIVGDITITGGTVTATSNTDRSSGAAIGAGATYFNGTVTDIGTIKIDGAKVIATSQYGAGIGAGFTLNDSSRAKVAGINITDSTVEATSRLGAGIGTGNVGTPSAHEVTTIAIHNSNITATSDLGAGIGEGAGTGLGSETGRGNHTINSISITGTSQIVADGGIVTTSNLTIADGIPVYAYRKTGTHAIKEAVGVDNTNIVNFYFGNDDTGTGTVNARNAEDLGTGHVLVIQVADSTGTTFEIEVPADRDAIGFNNTGTAPYEISYIRKGVDTEYRSLAKVSDDLLEFDTTKTLVAEEVQLVLIIPTVDPVLPDATAITGTADPGATITITLPNGDVLTTTVDPDGNWTVDIPSTFVPVDYIGDEFTVVATKPGYGDSEEVTDIIYKKLESAEPTIDDFVKIGDDLVAFDEETGVATPITDITGTGEPGATITVTFPGNPDDIVVTDIIVDENGNWSTPIPEDAILDEGGKIIVSQKEENSAEATEIEKTIEPGLDTPSVDTIVDGSDVITGKGKPGAEITVVFPDGTTETTTVGDDGTWSIDVPTDITLEDGDQIQVTQTEDGKTSETVTADVVSPEDVVAPPTVDPITPSSNPITGTGIPGAEITVTFPDGSTGTAIVDDNGNWSVDVPTGVLENGGDITVVQTEDGKTSDEVVKKIVDLVVDDIIIYDGDLVEYDGETDTVYPGNKVTDISGKGVTGDTIEVTFPDGTVVETIVGEDGTWSVPIPDGLVLQKDDEIIVRVKDENGDTTSEIIKVIEEKLVTPTVNNVLPGDNVITGTGSTTSGAAIEVTFPDGTVVTTTVNPDGTWEITVPDHIILADGDVIEVVQTHPDMVNSDVVPVKVTKPGNNIGIPYIPSENDNDDDDDDDDDLIIPNNGGGNQTGQTGQDKDKDGSTGDNTDSSSSLENRFVDFGDISDWARDRFIKGIELGLVEGYTNNRLNPKWGITRAEFLHLALRVKGIEPSEIYKGTFTDVNEKDWFANAVETGYSLGFVKGVGEDKFAPNQIITRQEMAVMINNIYNVKPAKSKAYFTDSETIYNYAKEAVDNVFEESIMIGIGSNKFAGTSDVTREMAVIVLVKILEMDK